MTSSVDFCTIVARNYLPYARVLMESLREHHPENRRYVLVVDDHGHEVTEAGEAFALLRPDDLDIPRFPVMAGIYDVLELCTAVKPWLLQHVLGDGEEGGAVYLDPDIRLYAPIDDVLVATATHDLVLSPHNVHPMPRDGLRPNEQDILIAGTFNLGFLGVQRSPSAHRLLDWWGERLELDCVVDPSRGFFVDQRWMDLIPGLTESLELVRDPGFNVAYWNLASRPIAGNGGALTAGPSALRLFHFSGFDPERPHLLSKHQNRIRLSDEPALAAVCAGYATSVHDAGLAAAREVPYGFAESASGLPINAHLRGVYRSAVRDGEVDGSLFDARGEREFLDWCNSPAPVGGEYGVTRYLERLYDSRLDLQVAFPDLGEAQPALGLVIWAHDAGREQVPIPALMLRTPPVEDPPPARNADDAPAASPARPERRPFGVNVVGYLRSELGVGEVSRQIVAALDAHGVPLLPVRIAAGGSPHERSFAAPAAVTEGFDINVVCVNADQFPDVATSEAGRRLREGHTIGVWWWELSTFPPAFHDAFAFVDEVWCGSRFVADALTSVAPVPVLHMPLPLALPVETRPDRDALGLPDGFVFLFAFDYRSVFRRKNPLGLLDAFTEAFGDRPDVHLVLKSINHEHDPDNHEQLCLAAGGRENVHLLDRYLSSAEQARLTASCDAYVSLHRSEGFGIGMAEAMLQGKPVIATDYGGNTDFLTSETGYPVRYSIVAVGAGAAPYSPEAEWAEPDLGHAAEQLRRVVEAPDEARDRAARARRLLEEHHAPAAAGARIARRLEAIDASRKAWTAPMPSGAPDGDDEATARSLIARGPAAPPGHGGARHRVREAALRLMKPYTAYADEVDLKLVRAIERSTERSERGFEQVREDRELARTLQAEAAVLHATALAASRGLRRDQERLAELITAGQGRSEHQATGITQRVDDLVGQVDRLRTELAQQAAELSSIGPQAAQPTDDGLALAEDYAPGPLTEPWSEEYVAHHRAFVARELQDPALLAVFAGDEPLPPAFGIGLDERVVEFPWLAAQRLSGNVLDAGSALNHLHVLARLRPRMDDLHIVTLAPEETSFPRLNVSYLFADLRDLPMQDASYDRVVSISTLEHVGMDNNYYGTDGQRVADPQGELRAAVRELARVLRPGGDCYITVPVGAGERFAWVRTLTPAEVEGLIEAFAPEASRVVYFAYDADGWQRAEPGATDAARYRDHFSSGPPGGDRRIAAEAVACIHLTKPRD